MQKYIEIAHRKNVSNALYITSIAINHHPIDYISLEGKQFPSKRGEEIAQMCGFDNSSYFGKVFKKITGHTPDEFRKNQNFV